MLTYSVIPPGALGATAPAPRPTYVPPRPAPLTVPSPTYTAPRPPIVQAPQPVYPQPARTAVPVTSAPVMPRVTAPGEMPRVPAPTTQRYVAPPPAPRAPIPAPTGVKYGPPPVPTTPRVATPSVPLPTLPRTTLPANGVPAPVKPFLQLVPPAPQGGARPPAGSPEQPPDSPAEATYSRSEGYGIRKDGSYGPLDTPAPDADANGLQRRPGPSMIAVPRFTTVPSAFPILKPPMSTKKKVAIAGGAAAGVTGLVLLLALL